MVLHPLKQDVADVEHFSESIASMRRQIKFCSRCFNVSDNDTCNICANVMRKQQTICVVETIRDVIAIESTQQYNGVYHVLGGVISPLDGTGPEQLNIASLIHRIETEATEELILHLAPIYKAIQRSTIFKENCPSACTVTTIARGIAFGGELEYADEMTLARSLANRLPVNQYVKPDPITLLLPVQR